MWSAAQSWPNALSSAWSWWVLLVAPFVGSFLGVLVERLPERRPVVFDRSRCPRCSTVLRPLDLVPLLSHAMLRGRCRYCGGTIAPVHWQMELGSVGVALLALLAGPDGPTRVGSAVLLWGLLALVVCDLRHGLLPDAITLPLILIGLGVAGSGLTDRAAGAVVGWGALALLAWGYRRLRGRDGLGGGDAKLLAVAGAWLGLSALGPVLLIGSASTLLAAITVQTLRRRPLRAVLAIPFGPGLALGIAVMRLTGFDTPT